ncbi:MAG: ABC transporter substrate-binding protein [Pirellulaceae bacterium]
MLLRRPALRYISPVAILVFCLGCSTSSPAPSGTAKSTPPPAKQPLQLLVVDDPQLGAAIAREWKSRTEGVLDVQNVALDKVLAASRLPADAVIYPAGYVGHLVERGLIQPLDDEHLAAGDFDRREIFDLVRLREISYGNRTVAVPLGSPQLLLVYRRDVFEKLGLSPPTDWQAYRQVVDRLAAAGKDASMPQTPTIEPLAAGWAGQLLLARAAAYASHRNQVSALFSYRTLEPLIGTPPYVRALEELVAANKQASPERRLTPHAVLAEVAEGRAAMGIAWPSPAPKNPPAAAAPLGFGLLPGSPVAYDFTHETWDEREANDARQAPLLSIAGRLGSVTTTTANPRDAQNFLAWLAGKDVSAAVCPTSSETTLFRDSHLAGATSWTGGLNAESSQGYAAALARSAALERYVSLRLPGRGEYLQALDEAVWAALAEEKSPAEALQAASARWQEITQTLGQPRQLRALRRSLGMEDLAPR